MTKTKPNILFFQCDQLNPAFLSAYGHSVVQTPIIDRLASESMVFDSAYCNFPLCAPSRFSMMSGRLASTIAAYDNGSEFAASIPTFAHALRLAGYKTCLSGKMHFIGPDQVHGFEERVTTDIYPADMLWIADWREREVVHSAPEVRVIKGSGVCRRSVQLDFDEDVVFQAERKLFDYARQRDGKPFFLTVSLTHPHDPFVISEEYWNLYNDADIDAPQVAAIPYDQKDRHSQRLHDYFGLNDTPVTEEDVRRTRHAYYGSISYVDRQVGRLLKVLDETGFTDDTVVVFTSDHGEFMGERGLWFKRSFLEPALRVPLMVRYPNATPGRSSANVSLVDLFPTFMEIAGAPSELDTTDLVGKSLLTTVLSGEPPNDDTVLAEILCECTTAPIVMVKQGHMKLIKGDLDPIQLFDLEVDPLELNNVADDPQYDAVLSQLQVIAVDTWDLPKIRAEVIRSQSERLYISTSLRTGMHTAWDYQPPVDASRQYYRDTPTPDMSTLISDALRYGVVQSDDGIHFDGTLLGKTLEAAARRLSDEVDIANAIKRAINESAGAL